jgi:hypothetical protein
VLLAGFKKKTRIFVGFSVFAERREGSDWPGSPVSAAFTVEGHRCAARRNGRDSAVQVGEIRMGIHRQPMVARRIPRSIARQSAQVAARSASTSPHCSSTAARPTRVARGARRKKRRRVFIGQEYRIVARAGGFELWQSPSRFFRCLRANRTVIAHHAMILIEKLDRRMGELRKFVRLKLASRRSIDPRCRATIGLLRR